MGRTPVQITQGKYYKKKNKIKKRTKGPGFDTNSEILEFDI